MELNLQRTQKSGKTEDFELKDDRITIGRDPKNKITVNKTYVSSRHAILTRNDEGEFFIEDCESRNGTFLNKVRIDTRKQKISVGDEIRFAYVDFEVVERPPANAIPVVPLSDRKKSSGKITTP